VPALAVGVTARGGLRDMAAIIRREGAARRRK